MRQALDSDDRYLMLLSCARVCARTEALQTVQKKSRKTFGKETVKTMISY